MNETDEKEKTPNLKSRSSCDSTSTLRFTNSKVKYKESGYKAGLLSNIETVVEETHLNGAIM